VFFLENSKNGYVWHFLMIYIMTYCVWHPNADVDLSGGS